MRTMESIPITRMGVDAVAARRWVATRFAVLKARNRAPGLRSRGHGRFCNDTPLRACKTEHAGAVPRLREDRQGRGTGL